MRTREQNNEYVRRYRFTKKVRRMKDGENFCHYCGEPATTLHHINENHSDNRLKNLLPVCNECHLAIPHICDKPNYYSQDTSTMPKRRVFSPKEPVTLKKTLKGILENCTTNRFYNLSMLNPTTCKKINVIEGSRRLVELLMSWGFVERI